MPAYLFFWINFILKFSIFKQYYKGYCSRNQNISPHISFPLPLSSGFLAGHMASQKKDYISQPPLELSTALWLSSSQWDTSKSDPENFQGAFLGIRPFLLYPPSCWLKYWHLMSQFGPRSMSPKGWRSNKREGARVPGPAQGQSCQSTLDCLPLDSYRTEK